MIASDRQKLAEIVNAADVVVRAASQLRLLACGRPLRDRGSLESAKKFLGDAIGGGELLSAGKTSCLNSSLRPLTWVADLHFHSHEGEQVAGGEYEELVVFLRGVQEGIDVAIAGDPTDNKVSEAAKFLQSLGEALSVRAEQSMRESSVALTM